MDSVRSVTNVIGESVYVETNQGVVNLKPGETINNVVLRNKRDIKPYTKIIEDLTEVGSAD